MRFEGKRIKVDHIGDKDTGRSIFRQEREGGIVAVCCGPSGKRLVRAVPSIRAFQSWFEPTRQKMTVPDPKLSEDWNHYGAASFYLEVLQIVPRSPDQSDEEYAAKLNEVLTEILSELDSDMLY